MLMWQVQCYDCDFKVTRLTRKEAENAIESHIREAHHERWLIEPVQEPTEPKTRTLRWRA